jgi:dTDP-4-amino-4,6-dideoxygalactose transaminase
VVRIPGLKDRDAVRRKLLERQIETGVHYYPNHRLSYFRPEAADRPLPVTDAIFPELLTLPLHPDLTDGDVDAVVAALSEVLDD